MNFNFQKYALKAAVIAAMMFNLSCKDRASSDSSILNKGSKKECHGKNDKNDKCIIDLDKVRPGQFAIGFIARDKKRKEIRAERNLEEYLKDNRAPVIIGPRDEFFLVDHHHLGSALLAENIDYMYGEVLEEWDHLPDGEFWAKMQKNNYVYLYDAQGQGPKSPQDLPKKLINLSDDPYRSLSGEVRDRGGFKKVKKPFVEFQWAQFFRKKVDIGTNFNAAVEKALKIARSPEASHLPGYIGNNSEED